MIEMDLAQTVGMIGYLLGVSALLYKQDRRMRLQLTIFTAVMATHFYMLGAVTAAIGAGISCIRSYVSIKTSSTWVMCFFILLLWGLGLANLREPFEVVTLIGTSVSTYGLFKTRGITTRILLLFNTLCWLSNNILVGSLGGMLAESTFMVINLFMIYRFWRESNTYAQPDPEVSEQEK